MGYLLTSSSPLQYRLAETNDRFKDLTQSVPKQHCFPEYSVNDIKKYISFEAVFDFQTYKKKTQTKHISYGAEIYNNSTPKTTTP